MASNKRKYSSRRRCLVCPARSRWEARYRTNGEAERVPRGGTAGFSPAALRNALDRHALTIEDFADEIGISRQAVSSWLAGVTTPSPGSLVRAARTLELTPADLTPGISANLYIADLRVRTGMTQTATAEQLGISQSALSEIERGRRQPDPNLVASMVSLYSVDEEFIVEAWERTVADRERQRVARLSARRARS
ncbi:helix-turn-helix domain-containing protein [Williamsia soli]|uniref:helix-turn-helix domain-containing protein n=1 Tax=Williamsia soli TaxID=364929 RepID=UPI003558F72E